MERYGIVAETKTRERSAVRKASRWCRLVEELKGLDGAYDLVRLLQHLLRLVQKAGPDYAAGIFLLDEETRTIQGQVTDLFDRDLNAGEGSLLAALRNPASFMISNLSGTEAPPVAASSSRSQILVPFRASPHVRGALILRSGQTDTFSPQDGQALSEFALRASALIESALIHQKLLRVGEEEVERDMVMAQEIIARLIPQKPPQIAGFEVASVHIPAKIVGGDLLDYLTLVDDHYGFMVADASGNGIPAALLMTGFRALFRGLIQNDFSMRSVFRKANQQLVESTASHQFVSAFYAGLDVTTNRLIYVNGGHVPPLLYRPSQPTRRLDVGGPVLGILPSASYHEDSVVLRPKDILICFSDGLSEAESAEGKVFDEARILRVVEKHKDESAENICSALQKRAAKFAGYNLQDDLTICVLKFI